MGMALWLTACQAQITPLPTVAVPLTAPAPATRPLAGAAGLDDPLYPTLGNGGYDVLHYDIDLKVDVDSNSLNGATTISARATQALSAFNLDFSGLTIGQVTVNGAPARYRRQASELTIRRCSLCKPILY